MEEVNICPTGSGEDASLSQLFDDGLALYNKIKKSKEDSNSAVYQTDVKKAINILEDATRLVSLAGIFSTNESVDEISCEDIKYFLLPVLLGSLCIKGKVNIYERMEVLNTAEVYFKDFLTRCKQYGIIDIEIPEGGTKRPQNDLIAMAQERNLKIKRYVEQKELEEHVESLKALCDNPNIDDETKREYYITLIKLFVNESLDELQSIDMEKPMLEHMQALRKESKSNMEEAEGFSKKLKQPPRKPFKPVIITRDEVQKKVFGAGYPSLPVMTVEEFYEKRVEDGDFPDPHKATTKALNDIRSQEQALELEEQHELEKERKIVEDDPDELQRARDWDEFKDDHRRGYGNRMNRS